MSAESAALTHSWPVGQFTATMSVPKLRHSQVLSAVVEWQPHVPQCLTDEEIAQYRAGRTAAIQALGLKALVIEL